MTDWPPYVTAIMGNDRAVALAYRTPAAGVVLLPVATIGMYDEVAGTITTTTSLGNWRKLVRIEADDRATLAFHARDHSPVTHPHIVVAQGRATFPDVPNDAWITPEAAARWEEYMPKRKRGRFWDWLGREYYDLRIPITLQVHRLIVFEDEGAGEPSEVIGAPLPPSPPAQQPPANGTEPRVAPKRYAKRLERARHRLIGYTDAEGFPMVRAVQLHQDGETLRVEAPALPPGGRRAGILAHWFEPQLVGQGAAFLTGWLEVDDEGVPGAGDARYAPHTAGGYAMPGGSELLFTLGGNAVAKFGARSARKAGRLRDGAWVRRAGVQE